MVLWTQVLTGLDLDEQGIRALDSKTWQERRQDLDKLGSQALW